MIIGGCSVAWLALQVWDLPTPVQIRATPFLRWQQKQKK